MAISQQRLLHGEGKDWVSEAPRLLPQASHLLGSRAPPPTSAGLRTTPGTANELSHLTTFNTSLKIVGVLCLDGKAGPAVMPAARRANEKSPTRGSSPLPGPSREGHSGREGAISSSAPGDMVSKTWPPQENKWEQVGGGTGARQGRLIKKTVITIIFKALFICD